MAAHILIVDDEPDLEFLVRQRFRRQIRDGEFAFSFARNGVEALSMARDDPKVGIILSDINMPRMDGLTLLNHLKEISRLLRVVIVSAYGDMGNIRIAMNRGAFDFVTKPIDFNDLEKTIYKALADLTEFQRISAERTVAERARAALARYFSPRLADYLADHPRRLEPGGARREISFLFTDLANFTPLVEKSDPDTIVALMNDYLAGVSEIVFDYGGTVDTVVGDAVHAMFGAPLVQEDAAARAVSCALAIDIFAEEFATAKRKLGVPLGQTRIGVHSGLAVVGNFGGEAYFHYTAHGDAVNTAARLESANKRLGTRICVSADTVAKIPNFVGRPVGALRLKGKDRAIEAFEPMANDAPSNRARVAYLAAFNQLRDGDSGAVQSLAAYIGAYPNDRLAKFHLERLLAGHAGATVNLSLE